MGWLFLVVIIFLGATVDALRWRHVGNILLFAVAATIVGNLISVQNLKALGEDASYLWGPPALLLNVAVKFILSGVAFLIGFGASRISTARKSKK